MAHEKMFGICENKCFVELNALNLDLYKVGYLKGNGSETKTHTLDFEPRAVLVFLKGYPASHYNASELYNFTNWGMAINKNYAADLGLDTNYDYANTMGISLIGNQLTLSQGTSTVSNIFMNLNKYAGSYIYLAFK